MSDPSMPRRLARRTLHASDWLDVHCDRVAYPGGRIAEEHYFLDLHRDGVLALIEDDAGRLLMIRSLRYVTSRQEWEFPGGRAEPGEDACATAARECLEETGWQTTDHRLVLSFHPFNGMSDTVYRVVHGRAVANTGRFDASEVGAVAWCTPGTIEGRIASGQMWDGFTLTAYLHWRSGLGRDSGATDAPGAL